MQAIRVTRLSKTFGKRRALDNVSIELAPAKWWR